MPLGLSYGNQNGCVSCNKQENPINLLPPPPKTKQRELRSRMESGIDIARFNETYELTSLLEYYGAKRIGKDYTSAHSTTTGEQASVSMFAMGKPSVTAFQKTVIVLSQ